MQVKGNAKGAIAGQMQVNCNEPYVTLICGGKECGHVIRQFFPLGVKTKLKGCRGSAETVN